MRRPCSQFFSVEAGCDTLRRSDVATSAAKDGWLSRPAARPWTRAAHASFYRQHVLPPAAGSRSTPLQTCPCFLFLASSVTQLSPRAHAAMLFSLSAPRATIRSTSSSNGVAALSFRPTARAAKRRVLPTSSGRSSAPRPPNSGQGAVVSRGSRC